MSSGPSRLRLNQENARWLGVCAGIADWLDVPTVLVRIIFVFCVISWPTILLAYFLLYFCLDKDISTDKMREYFSGNTAEHFRRLNYRKPIYKNERNKRIAGVCSGIADYFEVSAFAVRAVTLFSLFFFGPYTCLAYIVCMIVFDPDPHAPHSSRHAKRMQRKHRRHEKRAEKRRKRDSAKEEYQNFTQHSDTDETGDDYSSKADDSEDDYSRDKCTEIYSSLELRLREIEAYMTSKKFSLHCEINRI